MMQLKFKKPIIIAHREEGVRRFYADAVRAIFPENPALLPEENVQVHEVGDGQRLVYTVRTAYYGLVITGNEMPVMSGIEAVKLIRKENPDLHIYMLSGDPSNKDAAMQAGVTEFGINPISLQEFTATVLRMYKSE